MIFLGFNRAAFAENASLIVMASFAGHRLIPRSLVSFQWTIEIAMAFFQLEKYL